MEVKKTTLEEAPKVPFDLDGKVMYASQKLELVHLTMKPGEKIPAHSQPFDVIFFVTEGDGLLETDHENIEGTKNTSIFVPAGIQRGWCNTGPVDLKVLVFKDLV